MSVADGYGMRTRVGGERRDSPRAVALVEQGRCRSCAVEASESALARVDARDRDKLRPRVWMAHWVGVWVWYVEPY